MTATQDPHAFLDWYRRHYPDDLLVIDDPVSRNEEITGLLYELAARNQSQLVLCNSVTGLDVPVLSNVFASRKRIARVLETEPARLHERYQARSRQARPPCVVEHGPVLDNVHSGGEVDLGAVPMLRHFASDHGPYITSGILVGEDPVTGVGNMSYHRAMVHSPNELATSLHSRGDLWRMLGTYAERGEPMPVAMVLGGHPLFMLAASARVGYEVDERAIAGGLLGEPLEIVRTPKHGIGVPAWADYVLEGVIDANDQVAEGPFGEFSGYSSNRSTNNLLRVDTVLHRDNAMLIDVAGGNTADHLNLARIPREAEMVEQLKTRFPDVTAVHYPTSGTHFHCYVSLRGRRAGQARQVMLGLLGWDPYLKTVIAVNEDVDVADDSAVLWALAAHFQPHEDLFVVDGLPGSPLDPSSSLEGTTSRMGLDATRGTGFDGERIALSDAARSRARQLLRPTQGREQP